MINCATPEKFTHYCDSCKHKYVNMYDYPCNECFVEDRWEEAEEDPEDADEMNYCYLCGVKIRESKDE